MIRGCHPATVERLNEHSMAHHRRRRVENISTRKRQRRSHSTFLHHYRASLRLRGTHRHHLTFSGHYTESYTPGQTDVNRPQILKLTALAWIKSPPCVVRTHHPIPRAFITLPCRECFSVRSYCKKPLPSINQQRASNTTPVHVCLRYFWSHH